MKINSSRWICALALLIAAASAAQQPAQQPAPAKPGGTPVTEEELAGTWVAVHRSLGGLGSMWTFQPGGKLEMGFGAIVESWYKVEGDRLINPPGSTSPDAKPMVFRFRVEGDTLYQILEKDGKAGQVRYKRAVPARPGDAPIVGVWQMDFEASATPAGIAESHRQAGHEIDAHTAELMAEMARSTYHEYTRDGLAKIRIPMRTTRGVYDVAAQTFALLPEGAAPNSSSSSMRREGRFRVENGLLVLTQPDGKTEDTYIRATASKEELKRAGVSYGGTRPQLDPP